MTKKEITMELSEIQQKKAKLELDIYNLIH